MHVDLVEALRCPNPHDDGWLVATADVVVDRRIMSGTIGCPQCGAEWAVVDGSLHLGHADGAEHSTPASALSALPLDALRAAALLDLTDARGVVLLAGDTARLADALHAATGVLILTVNPPAGVARAHSRLFTAAPIPLGVGTMRGACLDLEHTDPAWLGSVTRVVQQDGRLIAPAIVPVPVDLHELARDDREWVAEVRVTASGLVPLRRGGDPMA